VHCAVTTVREDGALGLWAGAAPTVLRNGTNQMCLFWAKNHMDGLLWGKTEGDGLQLTPLQSMASGFSAAFLGPVATGPFDVVKVGCLLGLRPFGSAAFHGQRPSRTWAPSPLAPSCCCGGRFRGNAPMDASCCKIVIRHFHSWPALQLCVEVSRLRALKFPRNSRGAPAARADAAHGAAEAARRQQAVHQLPACADDHPAGRGAARHVEGPDAAADAHPAGPGNRVGRQRPDHRVSEPCIRHGVHGNANLARRPAQSVELRVMQATVRSSTESSLHTS